MNATAPRELLGFFLLAGALTSAYLFASNGQRVFDTPEQAATALVESAAKFDVPALTEIFGADGTDIFLSQERPQDQERAAAFAAQAREKQRISREPEKGSRAFLLVGRESWPFPVPLVKQEQGWSFDSEAGRQEVLRRRIGANELDAIGICRGYVEAQREYVRLRPDGGPNQYARRVISSPGKRDGLAWQNADGSWAGPVGQKIARAIEQGYTSRAEPYHGYYFKVLQGQGPAAPLGAMDFLVKGLMIGGFALVAAPAQYGLTGVKTFIVSHDGVVYEKDSGPASLEELRKMQRFNPDPSWTRVPEDTGWRS
jgi:hypothetical protein